jgi:hypothetical protein
VPCVQAVEKDEERLVSALPEVRLAWRPLGEILVERGLISELQLQQALRDQKLEGGRLGEILFARGWVSGIDLRDALAEQHGLDLRVEQRTGRPEVVSAEGQRSTIPLGRLLIQRGQITEAQLDAALAEQATNGKRLGQILMASGAISTFVLAAALAEQQGLLAASRDLDENLEEGSLPRPTRYEVREIENGNSYRLYASRNFLDATDLAFAILHEWEPRELHVVCVADDRPEELCWQYPPTD